MQEEEMKGIFSRISAIALTLSLFSGNGAFYACADTVINEYGTIDLSEETIELDMEDFDALYMPEIPKINVSDAENGYFYGDFIDKNNRAVYDALKELTDKPSEETVTVKFPEAVKVNLSALPNSESYTEEDQENLYKTLMSNCKGGRDCILFDYPEVFWLDPNLMSINLINTSYSYNRIQNYYTLKIGGIIINPKLCEFCDSVDSANEMMKQLDEAVENFEIHGDKLYDRLLDVYTQIAERTYYDSSKSYAHTAIGALVNEGVVCEGYSKALKLICDREKIPCVLVFGNFDSTAMTAHMWNYIQMDDGKWYAVDLTWDDVDGENGKVLKTENFLKGSSAFYQKHSPEKDFLGTIFTYPDISEEDYSFSQQTTTSSTVSVTEPTTTVTTVPPVIDGDFNLDGRVDIADAIICSRTVCGNVSGYNCDFDKDGIIDIFDFVMFRKYLINKI